MKAYSQTAEVVSKYLVLSDMADDERISFGIEDEKEDTKGFSDDFLDYFDIDVQSSLEDE